MSRDSSFHVDDTRRDGDKLYREWQRVRQQHSHGCWYPRRQCYNSRPTTGSSASSYTDRMAAKLLKRSFHTLKKYYRAGSYAGMSRRNGGTPKSHEELSFASYAERLKQRIRKRRALERELDGYDDYDYDNHSNSEEEWEEQEEQHYDENDNHNFEYEQQQQQHIRHNDPTNTLPLPPSSYVDDHHLHHHQLGTQHTTLHEDDDDERSINTITRVCRICLGEEDMKGGWVEPCKCTGSMQYVHQQCLNRWRKGGFRVDSYTRCELCKAEFKVICKRVPPSYFLKCFLKNPGDVLNSNLFVPPFAVMCGVLSMFFFFFAFCKTIFYVGPIFLLQLVMFGIEVLQRGRVQSIHFVRALMLFALMWVLVLAAGYLGKTILWMNIFLMSLISTLVGSSSTTTTTTTTAPVSHAALAMGAATTIPEVSFSLSTLTRDIFLNANDTFEHWIGWHIDFSHFLISSFTSSCVIFSFCLSRHIFYFLRKNSEEIVLDYHSNIFDEKLSSSDSAETKQLTTTTTSTMGSSLFSRR